MGKGAGSFWQFEGLEGGVTTAFLEQGCLKFGEEQYFVDPISVGRPSVTLSDFRLSFPTDSVRDRTTLDERSGPPPPTLGRRV